MVKLQFYSMISAIAAGAVVASGSNGQNLRRPAEESHRGKTSRNPNSVQNTTLVTNSFFSGLLHPHPHHSTGGSGESGGTSDYYGCLALNATELAQAWPDGPSCDYGTGSGNGGNGTSAGDGDSDGNSDDTVTQYEVVDDDTTNNPYEDFVITQVGLA